MKQGLVRLITVKFWQKVHGVDITHDNVCSSMLSCFYSHLLSTGRPISSFIKYVFNLLFTPEQLSCYFTSQYHLQGTSFVSLSSVTSTLKLKAHSQLTQSPFTGTDCLSFYFAGKIFHC